MLSSEVKYSSLALLMMEGSRSSEKSPFFSFSISASSSVRTSSSDCPSRGVPPRMKMEWSIMASTPPQAWSIFICWLMSRSMSPAVPLLSMCSMTCSVSVCRDEARSKRKPSQSVSASRPMTVVSMGAVMAGSASNVGCSTSSPGCHEPKYLSMVAITWSGSRSPDMQMATLLGTYHFWK